MQHQSQHEDICKAIGKMSETRSIWSTRGMTEDEWLKHKKENLQAVRTLLCRKLKPYEEQMFLFAKSCGVCHQQQDLKNVCSICLHVSGCEDHKSTLIAHDCVQLKISLLLHIYDFVEKQDVKISLSHLPSTMSEIVEHNNTEVIVDRFVRKERLEFNWKFSDYIYSEAISGPLTVTYTIHRIHPLSFFRQKETHVIHIIAGSLTDNQSLSAWEIPLHVLFPAAKITVIMIESELKSTDIVAWTYVKRAVS